jgi:hypothetical protein
VADRKAKKSKKTAKIAEKEGGGIFKIDFDQTIFSLGVVVPKIGGIHEGK